MADENEIDLYDNVDDNWKRESLDLYDDDEDSHSNSDNQKETVPSSKPRYAGKRVATYIGNLRWWTTDQDIMDALHKLDIKDILEIKFHENRQNGQSKGFCVAVFGSDKSAKEAMDKLPKSELHSLAPIVTYCNKQNLNYFEQAAGGGSSSDSPSNNNNNNSSNNINNNGGNKMKTEMNINNGPSMMNTNANPMQIGALGGTGGCNNMRFPGNMAMQGMPGGINPSLLFNLSQFTQNTMNRAPPNMMMHNAINGPLNMGQGPMNMSMAGQRLMQSSMMMQPGMHMPGVGGMTGGGGSSGPTPHLNPNFFNGVGGVTGGAGGQPGSLLANMGLANHPPINRPSINQQYDAFGRPITSSANYSALSLSPKLSDNEFEEILQRNKTVSSSAINRAVQDASAGDYASAIETLVTAISLIKQSKIAADNRCKVLINSLQDTLTGIESKSYGSRKARNQRRRSFSGDGSSSSEYDGGGGGSSRRVLRSRSRDRHHRSRRSRSRDAGQSSSSNTRGASRSTNNQQHSTSASNNDYISGSSDRYGASRYRH